VAGYDDIRNLCHCVNRNREQGQSAASAGEEMDGSLAIVSYDEKPGILTIGTTAPDLPPLPGRSPTVMRDHEYKRHGTVTLMADIDLLRTLAPSDSFNEPEDNGRGDDDG
jgi:hypothetical protein